VARLTRVESRQRTRQLLLDAAERLFVERGFHATSIEDIVEAAGFTRGALYSNFADKDDLFLTLLERRTEAQVAAYGATDLAPSSSRVAALQAWFDALTEEDRGLSLALAEFWPSAIRSPDHHRRLRDCSRALRSAITSSVEQYRDEQNLTLPYPAEQVAAMLLAIGEGFAAQHSLDPEGVPSDLFRSAVVTLWTGLHAAAERKRRSDATD
jgi:AcrR family transcriptional regulator